MKATILPGHGSTLFVIKLSGHEEARVWADMSQVTPNGELVIARMHNVTGVEAKPQATVVATFAPGAWKIMWIDFEAMAKTKSIISN